MAPKTTTRPARKKSAKKAAVSIVHGKSSGWMVKESEVSPVRVKGHGKSDGKVSVRNSATGELYEVRSEEGDQSRIRITARVPHQIRESIEQAATVIGVTTNQFLVQSAYSEAQRVLERETIIHLSQEDAKMMFALLENPPKPNEKLKEAFRAHSLSVRP